MAVKTTQTAQNPLILRCNRLIEAFAKSDDERDFYLDRLEGFIVYVDLDKSDEDLQRMEKELEQNKERYCMISKLTFYETKKIMEGFVNEKVYDIDTKEKLLDIIQSKEARENFLDFIYDHHSEVEKWQTYYQERSRIRIIEWLRNNHFHFVFEEDLDLPKQLIEKLKKEFFQTKTGKDVALARKTLASKAKTYYSNEALNPRPKRGRPPKQILKADIEPQVSIDIYTKVPPSLQPFLFTPDLSSTSTTFSARFGREEEHSRRHGNPLFEGDSSNTNLHQKLAALRSLSSKWNETENTKYKDLSSSKKPDHSFDDFNDDDDDDDDDDDYDDGFSAKKKPSAQQKATKLNGVKSPRPAAVAQPHKAPSTKKTATSPKAPPRSAAKSPKGSAPAVKSKPTKSKKAAPAAKTAKAAPAAKKTATPPKNKPLRSIMKLKKKR